MQQQYDQTATEVTDTTNRGNDNDVNNTASHWITEVTEETAWQQPNNQEITDTVTKKPAHLVAQKAPATTTKTTPPAKPLNIPKLTRKQSVFVQHLLDNPKASATTAAKAAYNVTTQRSAEQMAYETMSKPDVQLALANQADKALTGMIEIGEYSLKHGRSGTKEGASYASVAVSVYKDTLDRVLGKATQKVESTSQVVTLNIDLTGTVDGRD